MCKWSISTDPHVNAVVLHLKPLESCVQKVSSILLNHIAMRISIWNACA